MFLAEVEELGDAGHRAIVVHNFAYYGGGLQAGESREVNGAFGLSCADEDPAIACAEGEDVARAGEVGRFCVVGDCGLDGVCAVGGTDARGSALCGVDGDGEGGVEASGVIDDLRVKCEGVAFVAGERQAYKASAEFGHKVDDLRCNLFGGADEVAFVFAVFVIDKDDDFACAKVIEDVRYLAKLHCHKIKD